MDDAGQKWIQIVAQPGTSLRVGLCHLLFTTCATKFSNLSCMGLRVELYYHTLPCCFFLISSPVAIDAAKLKRASGFGVMFSNALRWALSNCLAFSGYGIEWIRTCVTVRLLYKILC